MSGGFNYDICICLNEKLYTSSQAKSELDTVQPKLVTSENLIVKLEM